MEIESLKLSEVFGKLAAGASQGAAPAEAPSAFSKVLANALQNVEKAQVQADGLARRFQAGEPGVGLEQAMIAMQKANISLQAMVQVRNRLISAYHDVMNMNV